MDNFYEKFLIDNIFPAEYNPRKITEKEFNSKLKALSYVEPIFDLFSNQLSSLSYALRCLYRF